MDINNYTEQPGHLLNRLWPIHIVYLVVYLVHHADLGKYAI